MNWSGKQVLVTGAAGFIGSTLTQKLVERGAWVKTLVRYHSNRNLGWLTDLPKEIQEELEIVTGDLGDGDTLQQVTAGSEIVFHLGAHIAIPYSYAHPRDVFMTNVIGTLNAVTAARDHGVERFIHTSTSEVYGSACYVPIDESHPLQGQSPYSASKIGADKVIESFVDSYDLPAVTVRPFNSYGPRQSLRAVIPTLCVQAIRENEIKLGNLKSIRDFTFVSDTAEGFIKAAENGTEGKVYNIGSGESYTIEEIANKVCMLSGKNLPILLDSKRLRPDKSEVNRLCADSTLARQELGWQPQVTIDDGLTQTLQWVRERISSYLNEDFVV